MVPSGISSEAVRRASLLAALILVASCARKAERGGEAEAPDSASAIVLRVRGQYQAEDAVATGGWTWTAPGLPVYVAVDVQSTIAGIVEGRLDLWQVADSATVLFGRSEAMPAVAQFAAWAFEDMTGDGVPDFFGSVTDSAGVAYPIFLPGARGSLVEELALAAPGWRFETEQPYAPSVIQGPRGPGGPCALRLWAEGPAPDGREGGWRFLALQRGGSLAAPAAEAPACN